MKTIYFDNAATTPLAKEVFYEMTPYLLEHFGNPSSHHEHGRAARRAIEQARQTVARLINASPEEIIFTSGGTEAHNTVLVSIIQNHQIKQVITSRFEHHAVLNTLENLEKTGQIKLLFIDHDNQGNLNLSHLEILLSNEVPSLVSIMHANNEIGNINDIDAIGNICKAANAIFHTDTVQTIGHFKLDVKAQPIDVLACSAHKFHGPKGIGFLYCKSGLKLSGLLHGGSQERKLRAGTENIPGIVGLAKALELANVQLYENHQYVQSLKDRLITRLINLIPGISFNGNSAIADKSLYTVLSVSLPTASIVEDPLQFLDTHHISVSGGSACSTGFASHVLKAINADTSRYAVRFSFSRYNTVEEIDYAADKLAGLYNSVAA